MIKTLTNKISSMDSRQRKSIEKFMTIAAFCTVMVFFHSLHLQRSLRQQAEQKSLQQILIFLQRL